MAGGFLLNRILVVKEDSAGAIPANPTLIEFLAESFDMKEEQSTEEIVLLGSGGDASPMGFGSSTYTGAVGVVLSTDNAPFILTHTLGARLTSVAATADVWTINTAYAVGDKVNHSDGKHTLVCYTAGTSHLVTEPTVNANPNLDRGSKITDNTVVWIAMPKLLTETFELSRQIPTFTIEYELENASAEKFYRRFSNVTANSLPIAMSGGTLSVKLSGDFIGANATASTDADWVEPLSAITGNKIVTAFKEFYNYDDCTVKVDDGALCEVSEVSVDTNRNVSVEDAVNGCKIKNIGTASNKGTITRVFETSVYGDYKAHLDFKLEFDFVKPNGCALNVTYPTTKPSLGKEEVAVDKQTYLMTEISPYGTTVAKSVQATLTYPSLVNSADGSIIGGY